MNYQATLLAAAQTVALFLSAFFIPVLGQAVALFAPVPLILLSVRTGRHEGMLALFLSAAAISGLAGWHTGVVFLFTFCLMAAGISEGLLRTWKPETTALVGGLLPVAALSLAAAYYFGHSGKNPVKAVEEYLRSNIAEAAKVYTSLGLTEMAKAVSEVSETFIHFLVRLLPAVVIATSVLQAAACYGFSRAVVLRKPGAGTALGGMPLSAWHAPDVWVWGLIVSLVLIMIPGETAKFTGGNLAILYGVVYLTQGIAVVDHYLKKAQIKTFVRGLIQAILLALPSLVFIIALGVVDIWADFRKVRAPLPPA